MKLINADILKKKLQARHDNGEEAFDRGYNIGIETAIDLIDNAPAEPHVTVFAENASKEEIEDFKQELENVLEKPQGKWIFHKDYNESCRYGCNQCGNLNNIPHNFCPNCGAKMRGEWQ